MTKKTRNQKKLFLLSALLLGAAFISLQYSAYLSEGDTIAEPKSDIPADQNQGNIQNINDIYTSVLQGEFKSRIVEFETPQVPYNIPFKNIVGKNFTLDDFKGQWVVLNFWASWCPPCITEMPSLQSLQDLYGGQGVQVIGIGVDRQMDGPKLRQIMQKFNFGPVAGYYGDWPLIKQHFEVTALPTTYILSPNGQAVAKLSGHADWVSEDAKIYIESLLN